MSGNMFYDCPQCGAIGHMDDLKDHPTRPLPDEVGFCPKCGSDVCELFDENEIREILNDYEEDADVFIGSIMEKRGLKGQQ